MRERKPERIAGKTRNRGYCAVLAIFIFLGIALVSAGFSCATNAFAAENAEKGVWKGNESELSKPFSGIIDNEKDWKDLWGNAFGKTAPAVDFNRYAAACVFLGHYPGWWYSIGMPEPRISGSMIIVTYQLADNIVELRLDASKLDRKYGNRGQYKIKLVEKKPGFSIRLEQVGQPQISMKEDFREILEKDRAGVPNAK